MMSTGTPSAERQPSIPPGAASTNSLAPPASGSEILASRQRDLYYATQVVELGHPALIALNMIDVAENNGHRIDADKLADALGVPVLPIVASNGQGVPELRAKIISLLRERDQESEARNQRSEVRGPTRRFCELPAPFRNEAEKL